MATTRTGRLVHLNKRRQAELNAVGRDDHDTYIVDEADDGTLVFTPVPGWTDAHLEILTGPEMLRKLRSDHSEYVEMTEEPPQNVAVARLARLALRHAGFWGHPPSDVEVPHPRWAQAVEAAAAAHDKEQALEAARAILDGPEATQAFLAGPLGD